MRIKWTVPLYLFICLWALLPAPVTAGDITTVIEGFMTMQFPEARSRFWVINEAQWQADNEVVIDLNTVVFVRAGTDPSEQRFLLLIVAGKLAAAQHIPLGQAADCQPERT